MNQKQARMMVLTGLMRLMRMRKLVTTRPSLRHPPSVLVAGICIVSDGCKAEDGDTSLKV